MSNVNSINQFTGSCHDFVSVENLISHPFRSKNVMKYNVGYPPHFTDMNILFQTISLFNHVSLYFIIIGITDTVSDVI